jgi:hypothetical protein
VRISTEAQGLLRADESDGGRWRGTDGHEWLMYSFQWHPGGTAALFVKNHRPDVCLPTSGMAMVKDDGVRRLDVHGASLPIRFYRFDDHGMPLHIFYCYWDARSSYGDPNAANEEDWTARGRLRAAMQGRREAGAEMLELVVWGYEEDDAAKEALQHQLAEAIHSG